MSDSGRFWHWPGWRQLGYAVALGLAETAWFAAIYGGAEWFTRQHDFRVRLNTPLDLAMPLVPATAVLYLSLNLFLWLAPFILRKRRELEAMAASLAATTLVAGIGFVLLPGKQAFHIPTAQDLGRWANIYHFARWLALEHNYLPSLHVAFTTICVLVYCRHAKRLGKALLCGWGAAIMASTLLTHQHYIADVATGLLLGCFAVRWIYRPWLAHRLEVPADEMSLPSQRPSPERSA